jgi:hypothetical protein
VQISRRRFILDAGDDLKEASLTASILQVLDLSSGILAVGFEISLLMAPVRRRLQGSYCATIWMESAAIRIG